MNWMLIVSGFLAAFATIGHFVMGSKNFLVPMLGADFPEVPKRVMHSVFHYISVNFVLSTLALLVAGFDLVKTYDLSSLVLFIAVQFALFVLVQLIVIFATKVERGLFRMFQWTVFLPIAVFAFLGLFV